MNYLPMNYPATNNRDTKVTQDDRKLLKHIEREQESKKLAVLIERVQRQLAQQALGSSPRVA